MYVQQRRKEENIAADCRGCFHHHQAVSVRPAAIFIGDGGPQNTKVVSKVATNRRVNDRHGMIVMEECRDYHIGLPVA